MPFVHTYFMKFRDIFLQLISAVHDCPLRTRVDSLVEETRSDGQARLFRTQISNQEYQSSPRSSRARLEPSIGIVHRDIYYQIFELKMEDVHMSIVPSADFIICAVYAVDRVQRMHSSLYFRIEHVREIYFRVAC